MQLHEFMSARRDEILQACRDELQEPGNEVLPQYVADFFDEMLRALRRDSGIRESESPLPQGSDAAARFGADRQRMGLPVTHVPRLFSAISQALGKVGALYGLTIAADEYTQLNRCLDAGLATSVENFWRHDKDRETQMLTEHFGFMAHELRNALGNANMAFKLLRTGSVGINGRTADVLARNLVRMGALVAQGLSSLQLEAGVAPELVPVRVAAVLRNLEAAAIPDRNITIQLSLDDQLFIHADEQLLSSAIGNLLHNAIKFSPPGATVQLGVHSEDGSAVIDVEDHCGGLKVSDPARLFEPFVKQGRGNSSGTGLGLAIAKRAVEAMHGELRVQDRPGHGCVFSARFPLMQR